MSNMAQSRRHVYSQVSGPDLGWPWEGCWRGLVPVDGAVGAGRQSWFGRGPHSPDGVRQHERPSQSWALWVLVRPDL